MKHDLVTYGNSYTCECGFIAASKEEYAEHLLYWSNSEKNWKRINILGFIGMGFGLIAVISSILSILFIILGWR